MICTTEPVFYGPPYVNFEKMPKLNSLGASFFSQCCTKLFYYFAEACIPCSFLILQFLWKCGSLILNNTNQRAWLIVISLFRQFCIKFYWCIYLHNLEIGKATTVQRNYFKILQKYQLIYTFQMYLKASYVSSVYESKLYLLLIFHWLSLSTLSSVSLLVW